MPPPLAAADWQALWRPTWIFSGADFPHDYAIRDISSPVAGPFTIGASAIGGRSGLGSGFAPDTLQAWGRIIGSPTITRRISDPLTYQVIEKADVTVTMADPEHLLTAEYRAAPFTLARYDAVTGVRLYEGRFLVSQVARDRDRVTITGKSLDLAILEERVPARTIDSTRYPLAAPAARGQIEPWVFGNVVNLSLPNVRDDQIRSEFDWLLSATTAAALTGLRRVPTGVPDPALPASFEMTFDELEPYPGMDGVLVNGDQEDFDAGVAVAATGWVLAGAGATVAKDITPANVAEGNAASAITVAAATTTYTQDLMANRPDLTLSWWQGREMTMTASVKAGIAARVGIRITDSVGFTASPVQHTGGGIYETLSVTRTIDVAATSVTIMLRIAAGAAATVQLDDVRVFLHARSFAECLRPDLYEGATVIRTYLRQEDSGGALFPLVADVHGLQPERNPVRAIRTLLSDAALGLGRTVDAASVDAAEAESCLTYEDAVNLDGPEVFLPFRDIMDNHGALTQVVRDRSGHDRHGVYHKGGALFDNFKANAIGSPSGAATDAYLDCRFGDGDWISIPDDRAFSGQSIALRLSLQIPTLPDATTTPIVEKLIGTAFQTGYGLYRASNALVWFIRSDDTTLYSVTSPLVDVADEDRWIEVHCEAEGGVLRMYRDGLLAVTASYSGLIAEGAGEVLIAKFGVGSVQVGKDLYDNIALYSHTVAPARVAAHVAALPLAIESVETFDPAVLALSPTWYYPMWEALGDPGMTDLVGVNHGVWTGGPALGLAPGPLTPERGYNHSGSMARFANDISKYGVETGLTLANGAFTVVGWYRPEKFKAQSGLIEKTIGGVRDTQWGLRQVGKQLRFTVVAASGTHTVDTPLVAEDVGRATFMAVRCSVSTGAIRFYKNGVLVLSENDAFTGPLTSGVGDLYIGCQGTAGGVRTRPCSGDLGRWAYFPTALTTAEIETLWLTGTWYNGGLLVDVALREAKQAQEWLKHFLLVADGRLDMTATGAITITTGLVNPSTIQMAVRDGAGDGDRNIVRVGARVTPRLDDTVSDLQGKYRQDLLTHEWLGLVTRAVSTKLDAFGKRIGRAKQLLLEVVRHRPTADRLVDRLAKRMKAADDRVSLTLGQDARRLLEGHLVQVTEAHLDYAATVLQAEQVSKGLETMGTELVGWDETANTYTPAAFPSGETSG